MDFESLEQRALEEAAGGHPDEAVSMLQEASERALLEAGALSRPARLQVLIAQLRMDTGDVVGARSALMDAFPGLRGPDGAIQVEVANRMAKMLTTMVGQADTGEAARLLDQLVELRSLQFGPEHPMTLAAIHRQAELLYEQGAFRLAEQSARQVVELRERALGLKNPLSGASSVLYARILEARQKPAEAYAQYDRAHAILAGTLGEGHAQTCMAQQNRDRLQAHRPKPAEPPAPPAPPKLEPTQASSVQPPPPTPPPHAARTETPSPQQKDAPSWPLTVPGGLWQPFKAEEAAAPKAPPVEPPRARPAEREAPKPTPEPPSPRRDRVQASWAGEGPVSWFGERGRPREASSARYVPPPAPEKPSPPPRAEWKAEPSLRDDSRALIQRHSQTEEMRTLSMFSDGPHRNLQILEVVLSDKVHASQHLLVHGKSALLLDPGGPKVFPRVMSEVLKALGREAKIEHILLSHQDPDCVSAVNSWMMTCDATVWLSALWHRFVPHFGLDSRYWPRMKPIADDGMWLELDGAPIAFLPAHFMHSPGNFHVWDPTARFLYTGDFGATVEHDPATSEITDMDKHLESVTRFHARYMASAVAVRPWLQMVSKLDIQALIPHHGPPYRGPQVKRFLDWCGTLKTGMELMPDAYALPPRR